jgi:hypothetical protein
MGKQSGLGDGYYHGGVDLSGDISALGKIGSPMTPLPLTGIDKSAMERTGGHRDGQITLASWFNPTAAQAHPTFDALPTTDVITTYLRGQLAGNDAFCQVAKQANYDGNRGQDGSLVFAVDALANAFGGEWTRNLSGKTTRTVAGNDASFDDGAGNAPSAFGLQAWLHVFALTGTNAVISVQDSADNVTFADLAAFTSVTVVPNAQRVAIAGNVRRYLRSSVTGGTFSSVTYAVFACRNATAVVF